jgi:dTDP-4-amino-4,6-dideoxygalactose transaminase
VFIDSDFSTWNMDPNLLADELSAAAQYGRLPKAVLAVDLYGQCADYGPIAECCQRYDVPLIEDAAEALGASYRGRPAGLFGRIGCFSFNGNKIITASSGGMLVTPDPSDLCTRARFLATQARDPAPHYEHSQIGFNYRMSNLLAAVARGQLTVLDRRVEKRRENFEYYRQELAGIGGIEFMPEYSVGRCNRWLTCLTVDPRRSGTDRNKVRLALEAENIESRPVWKPLHLQPVFADCRVRGGSVATQLFQHGLCLPSGSNLSDDDRQRVVATIVRAASATRRTISLEGTRDRRKAA